MLHKMLLPLALLLAGTAVPGAGIDNSDLIPAILPDSEVRLEAVPGRSPASPDWVKSLIIVEVNVETASPTGNFSGMEKVLDHLAETGVNGIWLTPINEGVQYGNNGVHTLNRALTNRDKAEERWAVVKQFVDAAHRRNIRVFVDVVSWGVTKTAPLYKEKPEWFSGASGVAGVGLELEEPGIERVVRLAAGRLHPADRRGRIPGRLRAVQRRVRAVPHRQGTAVELRPQDHPVRRKRQHP